MRFIAVTFFISLVVGDPGALLGKEECTYGPSYWCSNALNAKRCGAVKHCVDTVWTKTVITSKDTMECTLCKTAITEVKMMLKQNGTEEKIKEYVKEICDLLTDEAMKQMCTKFATTELPLLLDLIRSDMNPEQICSTIKMCTPGYVDTVQHKPVQDASAQTKMPAIQSSTVCTDCENFFKDIQNMIVSNETLEQLEDMLTQAVCSQLGPAKDMCNDVVKQFLPMILQYLGQLVDPATTCRIIGFCDTKRDLYSALKMRLDNKNIFMKFNKKSFGGQEECAVCKNVMTDLQNLDRDPTIQGKIEDFVKTQLCTLLGSLESECDKFVDENAPVLFQLLANELDPETVCSFVGFCRSVSVPKTSVPGISVVHLTKTQPIKALSLLPSLHIKKPVKTSGVLCSVCKVVMNELDSMLSKNATQDEIEKALKDVCNRLPAQLKDQCTDFVNQYAPAVIALLVQEMNPTTVCDTLGLCTPLTKKLKASIECVVCEFVMSEIEKILATNQTEAAVKSAFDKVCSLLPDTINTECTQFVNQYSSLIINLLINKVKPAQVCKALGLCKSTLTAVPKPFPGLLLRGEPVVQKQSLPVSLSEILLRGEPVLNAKPLIKKTDEECLVCKTILNYIDEALKENKTVEVIKQLLNKACEVLPTSMAQECEGIVIAFGDAIIKEIVQQLDPKQICTDIGLCQDKKSSKKSQTKKINTNEMIKTILEDRKKLENNVLYFKPRNPAQNRNPMKLVGEKKCTFGPSYWCKSYDTAKECGMIEHCKSKVWSRN